MKVFSAIVCVAGMAAFFEVGANAPVPFRAYYTPEVEARPQVRGVMLSQFTVSEADFKTLKEWGATVARYQMYPVGERWKGKTSDTKGFAAWLDWKLGVLKGEALPLARKYGIPLVVDLHVPPGGRGGSGMKMLDDPLWANFFVDCWRKIATQLKDEGGVYAYDLINEPTQFGVPKVCDYLEIQRRAASAIRKIDATTPIIVSCRNDVAWCAPSAFKWMKPIDLPNIFYQFHMYEPFDYTHQKVLPQFKETVAAYPDSAKGWDAEGLRRIVAPVRDFEKRYGAHIFVGEFSSVAYAKGCDKWIADTVSILNEYGWDWCYHAFREWPGWSVEHVVTEGDSAATAKFAPSADNPRRRALLAGLKGAFDTSERITCTSPNGHVTIGFSSDAKGMRWSLARNGKTLVEPSRLGLSFSLFKVQKRELGEMRIVEKSTRSSDTTWTNEIYRRRTIRDCYNELSVMLEEVSEPHRRLGYVFRAYDEGAAFRYVVPAQDGVEGVEILKELTEWRFPGKCRGWFTSYENEFNSNEQPFLLRAMDDLSSGEFIGLPATVEVNGQHVALCEAALVNWAGFYFKVPKGGQPRDASVLAACLTPLPKSEASTADAAVIREVPAMSPWRVAICADTQIGLLQNNDIIVNLNPPPEEGLDFRWVKPGASSWDWWVESNNSLSTELTTRLVDFAAEMGWPYHTIDGGWYGFARRPNHGPNVKLEPRKGFDLKRIVEHARERGVGIWVWIHWQEIDDVGIEETFSRLEKWGVKGVKTDFLNRQDQWIVCWYEKVARAAARHHIMVNFHGAHRPTGTERTWPNVMTREGIMGNEMSKFNAAIKPEHCLTLPFTRFLIGPGDFTPGSFANAFSEKFTPQIKRGHRYGDESDRRQIGAEEIGTRAHAIAQCIAFDSYLTTLCDWPERYRGARGIEALRALPTVWKNTTPVEGECGQFYSVVRETHDGRFYFAALTVKRRRTELNLGFLGEGEWMMDIYADDPELTPTDPKAIRLSTTKVSSAESILFDLVDEGGVVAVFSKIRPQF